MSLTGQSFIAGKRVSGSKLPVYGVNPATNEQLLPAYNGVDAVEVAQAATAAAEAFDVLQATYDVDRAKFLETIADNIIELGDELIVRAMAETGLPRARLEGERARTVGQLRLFAHLVRTGDHERAQHTRALPERKPAARSDIRLRYVGLGPVAVFGASNFPLAFSVAGGDTAAAFAAGCPVVVKAHSAHPGTSELVATAVQQAVVELGLPNGTFSLVYGSGNEVGTALVEHPAIKAVGFTGSRTGGLALMRAANARKEPIPVYAEMSSQNPVVILPGALAKDTKGLAKDFVASLTQGAGQFCTNPGLVLLDNTKASDDFITEVEYALADIPAQTMLTPGIYGAYAHAQLTLGDNEYAQLKATGLEPTGPNQAQAFVYQVTAAEYAYSSALREEVFGPTSIVVRYNNNSELVSFIKALEGQLTATVHGTADDYDLIKQLVPELENKVGRIVYNGWPTGVEVCEAIVHGGPFPATSDGRSTSVGTEAITRFQRPVAYQDFPLDLLPPSIREI